jgi:uncharacterized alpha/beta hydrolase family protein
MLDSGDESDSSVSSAKSSDLNEFLDEEERRMQAKPEACPDALHADLYYNEIHKVRNNIFRRNRRFGVVESCSV